MRRIANVKPKKVSQKAYKLKPSSISGHSFRPIISDPPVLITRMYASAFSISKSA